MDTKKGETSVKIHGQNDTAFAAGCPTPSSSIANDYDNYVKRKTIATIYRKSFSHVRKSFFSHLRGMPQKKS